MITHPSAHSPASLAPLPGAAPGVRLLCSPASPRGYSWWGSRSESGEGVLGRWGRRAGVLGTETSDPEGEEEDEEGEGEEGCTGGGGGPRPTLQGSQCEAAAQTCLAAALMLVPASSSRPTGESRGLPEQPPWTPCLESRPPAPTWQSFVPLGSCPSCRPLCTIPCGVGS